MLAPVYRNPLHPAALTAEEFEARGIGRVVCIVTLNPDDRYEPFRMDWQRICGWTRRQHAKLEPLGSRLLSSGHWNSRFVAYHELGLTPQPNGEFAPHFCVGPCPWFLYAGTEELFPQHDALFRTLQAAEPRLFWHRTPMIPDSRVVHELPRLSLVFGGEGAGDTVAYGCEAIEKLAGHISERIRTIEARWYGKD